MARTWHTVWHMDSTWEASAATINHHLTNLIIIDRPRPSPSTITTTSSLSTSPITILLITRHPYHPPSSSSFHVLSRKPQVRKAHFPLKEHRAGRSSSPRCVAQPCYSLAVLRWAGHGVVPRNQNYVYEASINIRAHSAAVHVSIPHFLFHK